MRFEEKGWENEWIMASCMCITAVSVWAQDDSKKRRALCQHPPPRPEITAVGVLAEPLSEVLVVCICLTELGRYSYKSHVSILTEYFS